MRFSLVLLLAFLPIQAKPADILITHATIVTMQHRILEHAAIAITYWEKTVIGFPAPDKLGPPRINPGKARSSRPRHSSAALKRGIQARHSSDDADALQRAPQTCVTS
jgi:hypothetical protein